MPLRALLFLFAVVPLLCPAQPSPLEEMLSKPILGPSQARFETQVFAESRVPTLPTFRSAAEWERYATDLRRQLLEQIVLRGEAARWRQAPSRVEWLDTLPGGPGYRIRKLRYEAVPGLWVPALLYEPEKLTGRVPVVLNVNGHEKQGNAVPYIQTRCINLARRGLLALNVEWFGRGQLATPGFQHSKMNQLDLCGTSGLAVHYLSLSRAVDLAVSLDHADPRRVAVTGLSGGGWQTILIASLDPRVALANPVAGYSSFLTRAQFPELDLGDSEQTPTDLATLADYTHLTALLAPRPALLTYNSRDTCCFRADYAVGPLLQAARPVFALLGKPDHLRHHVNYGPGHNYDQDNREAFYRMLGDHFFAAGAAFDAGETAPEPQPRTEQDLHVPLPADNADFHVLARRLGASLPRPAPPGEDRASAVARLRQIVRARDYSLAAVRIAAEQRDGLDAAYWRLRMGDAWTVPAVELSRGGPKSTALVVADGGRAGARAQIEQLLAEGRRVVAIDPFYFGESRLEKRDFLFALLVAAFGDRPLGVQASQVAATARWLESRRAGPVTVVAVGPRASLFALIAAALEPAIAGLSLRESMGSLREILDQDLSADKTPELFCFGLLEAFDIPQLTALVAPRPVGR